MPQAFFIAVAKAAGTYALKLGASAAIANFIAGAVLVLSYATVIIGPALYSRAQAKKAARSALNKGRSIMFREPAAPRQIIYGEVRTSGPLLFVHTTGARNETLWMIVGLAGHEVEAINTVYFDDKPLTLDGSGNVTSAPFAGKAVIYKYTGLDTQTANADLITAAPTIWTSAHRLRGIAYILVKLTFDTTAFPTGAPNISAIVRGRKILDTRTSTTAYSTNWALCVRDYLTHPTLGLGVAAGDIDTTALNAAANVADEDITLNPSGTEKRYTINGVITTDAAPGDVLEKLVVAGAGFASYLGGKWVIHAGAYRTPTVTLTEDDLRGSISVQTKVSRREIFNGVKGLFFSPDNQWQASDFPPIVNATYTTEDGGERIWQDVELPFTTSNATAQRLAKIALERVRQQIIVRLPCKLTAFRVQAGDNVMLTNARMGWSAKVFEVVELSFAAEDQGGAQALGVDLTLRETASAVWDWNNGEETTIDPAPNTDLPDPRNIPTPTGLTLSSGASTVHLQADGTSVPRLKAVWDSPPNEFVLSGGFTRIEYKPSADTDWLQWVTVGGDIVEDFITDVLIGVSYDVRIRHVNRIGALGAYQTVTGHVVAGDSTGPAIPTGLVAITGTGAVVSLDWNDNTEADLGEYGVYRSTTSGVAGFAKIAEVAASRFVDVDVTIGTQFWYRITAIDRSENESSPTTAVDATPGTVTFGEVDPTAPGTPSAPTFNSESTYLSGDGTVFAQVTINLPAMPTDGIGMNVLSRVSGSGSFITMDQRGSGGGTSRIDDLSPGVAYEFAVQAFSRFGSLSTVSTVLSRTSPGKTDGPSAPTSLLLEAPSATVSVPPRYTSTGVQFYGARFSWTRPADKTIAYFEVGRSNNILVDPTSFTITTEEQFFVYDSSLFSGFMFVRSRDRSGVASAYQSSPTNLNTVWRIVAGDMSQQDSDDVETTGITTGSSTAPQVLVRDPGEATATLVGGATTEKFNIAISSRGFSTKPDTGFVRCISNFNIETYYDKSDAASTSTNAVVFAYMNDGANLPAGLQSFIFEFIEIT